MPAPRPPGTLAKLHWPTPKIGIFRLCIWALPGLLVGECFGKDEALPALTDGLNFQDCMDGTMHADASGVLNPVLPKCAGQLLIHQKVVNARPPARFPHIACVLHGQSIPGVLKQGCILPVATMCGRKNSWGCILVGVQVTKQAAGNLPETCNIFEEVLQEFLVGCFCLWP